MCFLVSMFISTFDTAYTHIESHTSYSNHAKDCHRDRSYQFSSKQTQHTDCLHDEEGYPIIHPIWFLYDNDSGKIYITTSKMTRKTQSIQRNLDKIYFSIDDENIPYKGVKGRAIARISEDMQKNLSIVEKINLKYLGTLEHPIAKRIIENTRSGNQAVIEITPKFFSAWDFGKAEE